MLRRPHGIDCSQYNVGNTFEGLGFVMIRATSADGGLHVDSALNAHVALARKHDVPFGLYHFAANGTSATDQAHTIVIEARRLEALKAGDIGIVIDCEAALDGKLAIDIVTATKHLLAGSSDGSVRRHEVGIYSGGWVKARGGSTLGADWGWLAQWGASRPVLPVHWHRGFCRLWQYAGGGTDQDVYRGSHRSFRRWLAR